MLQPRSLEGLPTPVNSTLGPAAQQGLTILVHCHGSTIVLEKQSWGNVGSINTTFYLYVNLYGENHGNREYCMTTFLKMQNTQYRTTGGNRAEGSFDVKTRGTLYGVQFAAFPDPCNFYPSRLGSPSFHFHFQLHSRLALRARASVIVFKSTSNHLKTVQATIPELDARIICLSALTTLGIPSPTSLGALRLRISNSGQSQ